MLHRQPTPPWAGLPLTDALRARLWQAMRSRAPHVLAHLGVALGAACLAASAVGWAMAAPAPGRGAALMTGAIAVGLGLLALQMVRVAWRLIAPFATALWRDEVWAVTCPATAMAAAPPAQGGGIAVAGAALPGPLVMELPPGVRRLSHTVLRNWVVYPRATPLQLHVLPAASPVLIGLHHADEPVPTVQRHPLQHWPLPLPAATTAQWLGALALGMLAMAAGLVLGVWLHLPAAGALLVALLVGAGVGWGVFRHWQPVMRAFKRRGAAPEHYSVQGHAQAMLEIMQVRGGYASRHVRHERWLMLGHRWHLLDTATTREPVADALPWCPPALAAVRLDYARWGRDGGLLRAVDEQGRWLGGARRPPHD